VQSFCDKHCGAPVLREKPANEMRGLKRKDPSSRPIEEVDPPAAANGGRQVISKARAQAMRATVAASLQEKAWAVQALAMSKLIEHQRLKP
jgi:hypothetical protein